MKKSVIYILLLLSFFNIFMIASIGAQEDDTDNLQQEIQQELYSIIDEDVLSALNDIGLDGLSFDDIYNISFESIGNFFADTLTEKLRNSFKSFFEFLCLILLTGILSSVFSGESNEDFIGIISVAVVSLMAVNTVSVTLSAVVSVLEVSGQFMLSFVPIYTLIISLSGNPTSALTYNTFVIAFAEIISSFLTSGITDFLGVFFCLGISFSFNSTVNIGRIISAINKAFSVTVGLLASLFTGFLSIKSILSVSVDSLSVKGIRFLIGSMIPIVGSSISDAYSAFLGSINLIRGSVAVIGILVIAIINIPVIFEALIHYISFSLLGYVADSVSAKRAGDILKCFSCGMRILMLVCIFEMFIMIISTGVLLSVKNGG